MMGPKKLSEIKRDLRQQLAKGKRGLRIWLDRQIELLQTDNAHDPKVAEDLLWVRKSLRTARRKPVKR